MSYNLDNNKERSAWDSTPGTQSFSDSFQNPQSSQFPQSQFQSSSPLTDNLQNYGNQNAPGFQQQQVANNNDRTQQRGQPLRLKLIPYEEFIKNKVSAMMFFAKNDETKQQFSQEDVDRVTELLRKLNNTMTFTFMSACTLAFAGDHMLRSRNLIYGMTYRNSLFKFLFKFWVLPTAITSLTVRGVLQGMYLPKMEAIASRYNFSDDIFRNVYEREGATAIREREQKEHPKK